MKDSEREIIQVNIEEELKSSYLDYAMSVIVGRALPDVRDGLKPVHRRILFAMHILNNNWNKAYKKSARIVGDVIGKYHPHGDSAVYDAIVRMAQKFSLRYMLIDGQGNFGSVDGDSAAAMRYTEIRMSKIAHELLTDLEKNTVEFLPNYDGTENIPEILPARIPNLLINGSSGIAVGMATNIPPHNLHEVIDGCLAYINNNNITLEELIKYIPGPDFPTAGIINGKEGIEEAYRTGKGKIYIRARYTIEKNQRNKKESIIFDEIPYQVNKARLIEKIAELVKDKRIDGITALRDESDQDGMRIVIEIKKESISEIILNQLYSLTQLQISFGINMVALCQGQPKTLSLKEILKNFISHRQEIIVRRSLFELKKTCNRLHILEAMNIALININLIIKIIKNSKNLTDAKLFIQQQNWISQNQNQYNILQEKNNNQYYFTEQQVQAILDLRLHKLTNLEQKKIILEYDDLIKKKEELKNILENPNSMFDVIKEELISIKNIFSDKRRTEITENHENINIEDLINQEDVVVTLSHSGYVKYQPLSDYNAQRRGGKGKSAAKTKEEDFIESLVIANTHDTILCFSSRGILYWMKVYQLPESSRHARGRPIVNLLPLSSKERITAILPVHEYKDNLNIFMATAHGIVKKSSLSQFKKPRLSGIIAINLHINDELIGVSLTNGSNNIMLFTQNGKVVQFLEQSVRTMGRTASGVKGIKVKKNDKVVSLIVPKNKGSILIATKNGYGKRTKITDFPIKSRATQGVISIKITKKNGHIIGAIQVLEKNQIMMITNAGTLVRIRVSEVGILGRNTQGVILIRTAKNEQVVALQKIVEPI
ncbi:DNA topoisomerase (ATP-hydrolyzing) subunit A [Buchnera aphidicola]|uniref:DNA gyrase subunit A n=1 Tax=Buchnera aphidicola str. USDA (Myzus persicae) TaxID=1009856 RepID=W0P439_BUCMP|nr:DNA topoisomerase (ATP-hydrolyzing) subunit A [Buchnera aphidicola]AHG60192.1 Gyra [Buchnera aphidicola str. USDA (Myzus persicae)]AHG60771.1 Gyra [Buchnera aphidicola str. W106 (Myzus persicae)]AHG61343.1 Gyra [Buchnera aphidicola str. G002 (Myzus persicae)]AHG61916.1 Gyra [Buchnera aphidicola str. F009 (Myzus persicae)]WAI03119.1 MAG: DNA topoisomerase (ATP-hydrolyzing) subunit A [Buchnera aphidicola (Myzus persicae)]